MLTRWAAGRAFVWLDAEIAEADRRWAAMHHPEPVLLHHVDPYRGQAGADLDAVRHWL